MLEPEEEEEEDGLGGGREGTVGEAARQPLGGGVGDLDEDRVAVVLLHVRLRMGLSDLSQLSQFSDSSHFFFC